MQNILVLTDFSPTASHAAVYAANLARHFHSKRLIMLNVYPATAMAVGVPVIPEMPVIDTNTEELRKRSVDMLEEQRKSVQSLVGGNTSIETIAKDEVLEDVVSILTDKEGIDLIVMGIAGKSSLEKILVGSNTIRVLERATVPLIIVPAKAQTTIPSKLLLALDFEVVREGKALPLAIQWFNALQPEICVLNVTRGEGYSDETREDIIYLHQLLDRYNTSFHYVENKDVADTITDFAEQQHASMIVAIHHKKSGIASLFHKSISKKLAWHSEVPLLILPD